MEGFPVAVGVMMNIDKARSLVAGRKATHVLSTAWAMRRMRNNEARVRFPHWKFGKLKDEPVLVVKVFGVLTLIDGWHRARKAFSQGKIHIAAVCLTEEEARLCAHDCEDFVKDRKKKRK